MSGGGPHVSDTRGRSNLGQLAGVNPRLVAGGARDGGGVRFPSSGDQMAGGGRLRDAGTRLHRVVAAAGPKMAGVVTGIDRGGRRSSGELGVDATVAGEARAGHLRVPGSAGRKLSTTAGPLGGRRHVGGDHRRRRVSVIKGATATAIKRRGKERGKRWRSSQGLRRWPRGARGGVGGGESPVVSFGGRRRNGDGGGVAGLPEGRGSVEREEGVEAEPLG